MGRATYIVASTPRSGSSLLSEGLEATGVVGRPTEVFAPDFQPMWEDYWSLPRGGPFGDFLQAALVHGTTPNGIYGLKIHWEHVEVLARRLAVTGERGRVLDALYPNAAFVNIVRRDRRAQALSLFRAMATNEWCRFVGAEAADVGGLTLDSDAVRSLAAAIGHQQDGWMGHFRTRGIEPLTVEYERLANDYRGEVGRVLTFLGFDASATESIPEPRLARQSDELNAQWLQQLRRTDAAGRAA